MGGGVLYTYIVSKSFIYFFIIPDDRLYGYEEKTKYRYLFVISILCTEHSYITAIVNIVKTHFLIIKIIMRFAYYTFL